MQLYNSLSKTKENFVSRTMNKVSMYHCGPTVYDHVHIGNLRSFMMADFIRRSFEYLDYKVTQVMNITDVGHLVSDGDDGDDKMTKALKRGGREITLENMIDIASIYEASFKNDLDKLNILTPHHMPKASDHIMEDIAIISSLEEKGFTYVISDGVYFDTDKMPDYGKLGGLNLDDETESRIKKNNEKKNPADFALWKFDEKLGWDSPWGQGFPGWHIECSGMAQKYLGNQFDIHTGGADLKSVHHNNEIAQSECSTGCSPYVKYWMHGEMLNFGGAKLSKSTGGNITLGSVEEKGFHPLDYRYLALQTHYRSPMNFTWEVLEAAHNGRKKILNELLSLSQKNQHQGVVLGEYENQFKERIQDDINFPQALSILHNMLKSENKAEDKVVTAILFDEVFGIGIEEYLKSFAVPNEVVELAKKRIIARKEKNWSEADRLRDAIAEYGFDIKDEGTDIFSFSKK
tara:strand:+ start:5415 stop:6797 length:1383 start_codon:yes stop_codon:yes gene_type:complete